MIAIKTRTTTLRLAAITTWLVVCALTLTPTSLFVSDVFAATDAQPAAVAPTTAPTAAPAAPVAPAAPTVAPTVTPEPEQAWWQALLAPVLSVLGLFVAAFLAAGLRKLVQLIEKKWSIDIPDSIETLMTNKARWAIALVEEKAEKRLLHGDGQKTPGAEKITDVVNILEKFAQDLGYGEDWRRDKIEALAEGVLHLERDVTIGSSGARAEKLEDAMNGNGNE